MNKILYIQASPRGNRSKCIKVADAFIDEYLQKHPEDKVEIFNVFESTPDFGALEVQAKYTIMHGKEHTDEELTAWKNIEKTIEQFKSSDKYILAVPMWNFSIPYRLKQYIDVLIQPGYTFNYSEETGYKGLITGKPLLAVYARGGEYKSAIQSESMELQKRYIDLIFGFIGFDVIQSIIVEPTLQAGPDVAESIVKEAIGKAKELACNF
jgi:FMN-dependent NADH-azoreductase